MRPKTPVQAQPGHYMDSGRRPFDEDRAQVFVSAASAWEIATKVRIGKLPGAAAIAGDIPRVTLKEGFKPLSVTIEHGQRAGALPGPLRDPFDRTLIAQAMLENQYLVSIEHAFDAYGVLRLW